MDFLQPQLMEVWVLDGFKTLMLELLIPSIVPESFAVPLYAWALVFQMHNVPRNQAGLLFQVSDQLI